MTLTFGSLMAIVACVLFVIAALVSGGLVAGIAAWTFGFGVRGARAGAQVPVAGGVVSRCDAEGTCQYDKSCVFYAENCRHTERQERTKRGGVVALIFHGMVTISARYVPRNGSNYRR